MKERNDFLYPKLTFKSIDRYLHRKSIFQALTNSLNVFQGDMLDLGCGKMPYKDFILQNSSVESYIGLDIDSALVYDSEIKPDYTWDGINIPFTENKFDCAIATEVLEHCPNPMQFLTQANKVLKQGGVFFFTVPFLWNLHEVPHDEYRYTPFSLKRLLESAGFKQVQIYPFGGWHASMAQMLGLWIRRSPMPGSVRRIITILFYPFYKFLLKVDSKPSEFSEGLMISGISGIAYKISAE